MTDSTRSKADNQEKTLSEETRRNIPIFTETPSWDDEPLQDGDSVVDRLYRQLRAVNVKMAAAVLGGVVLLAALIFGLAVKRHSGTEPPAPAPDTAAAEPSSNAPAVASPGVSDGESVYTANLIPPPDSYVE